MRTKSMVKEMVKGVDSVVTSILYKVVSRSVIGAEKYGTNMDRQDLYELDWLRHLQEELLDASIYVERLIKDKQREIDDGK